MAINCTVKFLEERCVGCGLCIRVCPRKILVIDGIKINAQGLAIPSVTDTKKCIGCGSCNMICPEEAIQLIKD